MTTINNTNINNNNKEVVIMTTSQARQYASQLLDEGRLDEAIHILCSIAAEEAKAEQAAKEAAGPTTQEKLAKLGSELAKETQDMFKEAATDLPLIARDLANFSGRLLGGALRFAGRTVGGAAAEFMKGWNEAARK